MQYVSEAVAAITEANIKLKDTMAAVQVGTSVPAGLCADEAHHTAPLIINMSMWAHATAGRALLLLLLPACRSAPRCTSATRSLRRR